LSKGTTPAFARRDLLTRVLDDALSKWDRFVCEDAIAIDPRLGDAETKAGRMRIDSRQSGHWIRTRRAYSGPPGINPSGYDVYTILVKVLVSGFLASMLFALLSFLVRSLGFLVGMIFSLPGINLIEVAAAN